MLHVYSEEIIANLFVVFKSDIIKSKFIELNSVIKGCLFGGTLFLVNVFLKMQKTSFTIIMPYLK